MIYFDSSALLKLLFDEPESAALVSWLQDREGLPPVSSELTQVEVIIASRRLDPAVVPVARRLLGQVDLVPLRGAVLRAAEVGEPPLRTLDALHLASALVLGAGLSAFLTYDARLAAAAQAAGLPVAHTGS